MKDVFKEFWPLMLIAAVTAAMFLTSCAHTPLPGQPGYRTCTHYSYHTNAVTGQTYQESQSYNCN